MAYKIEVSDECIGCGACAAQCDNFEIDGSKAVVKEAQVAELGTNQDAVDACPVGAIKIKKLA
ncbi:MAG TPA: ferredoxin [Candidatus Nanoarchaeia archaeon]|nr:ferredoxin [Candidatus Nanoarchaeia archaeon]